MALPIPPRRPALIDGRPVEAGSTLPVRDPATGTVIAEVAACGPEEIDAAVAAARRCHRDEWRDTPAQRRAALSRRLADLLRERAPLLAAAETLDTGKPISQARADVAAAARYFDYYANTVEALFGETVLSRPDLLAYTVPEPHGVCGHIIPWNYPLQVAARTVSAALAAGNCCVLKPAEDAPLTPLLLGELALEAGFPPGALNVVPGHGTVAGAALASHPGIDHMSFTGSRETGRSVMAAAAANIVPVTLELGGKSPHVVLADSDMERAVPQILGAIIEHAGQNCTAGSRVIAHESIRPQLVERLAQSFRSLRIGPGLEDPDLGPLISERQRQRVLGFLRRADRRADLVTGGGIPDRPGTGGGFFVEPTLYDCVPPGAELAQEEIFGPVLCVTGFHELEEAVEIANGTAYGLGAAVWSGDASTAQWLAREIRSGQVFINTYAIAGGVELPFGGMKASGFGVEKGFSALRQYTRFKTVAVHTGAA
ncbi:aldehyde dehydrogenase family protein [Streptomyces sp. NPDC050619]|uniref:aldehyde dehydrogenase family protein n=1 Tax=Streptomyces sp. NPDC050619 TaxID=3157214 RepID=UPI003428442E